MLKRLLFLAAVTAAFIVYARTAIADLSLGADNTLTFNDLAGSYDWAQEAVSVLAEQGAVSGIEDNVFSPKSPVTKEQLAKMLVLTLEIEQDTPTTQTYIDVPSARWSFHYVEAAKDFFVKNVSLPINQFAPEQNCTREEVAAALVSALGLDTASVNSTAALAAFSDSAEISPDLTAQMALAVEKGILQGSDSLLRPKAAVSRAEAAVFLHRAVQIQNGMVPSAQPSSGQTPISGSSTVTLAQAKSWATARGAHERFIAIADTYWKYGEKTGIRPEVLYAQAAKETNYGKYTGNVVPEQNNWAGIKTKNADGDKTEDHETFATPEDGVRAHFNHMAAYLGKSPSGKTHDRYEVVMTAAWAGSIEYAEELGGRWAPNPTYGYDLVEKYLVPMQNTTQEMQ